MAFSVDDIFAPGITDVRNEVENYKRLIVEAQKRYSDENLEYNELGADYNATDAKVKFIQRQLNQTLLRDPNQVIKMDEDIRFTQFALGVSGTALAAIALGAKIFKVAKYGRGVVAGANATKAARIAKASKVLGAITIVIGIVDLVLTIKETNELKDKLEQQRDDLRKANDELNKAIDELNEATKTIAEAFIDMFDKAKVDYSGAFNSNLDGYADRKKFMAAYQALLNSLNQSIADLSANSAKDEMALKMLATGMGVDQVVQFSGLPKSRVVILKQKLDEGKVKVESGKIVTMGGKDVYAKAA